MVRPAHLAIALFLTAPSAAVLAAGVGLATSSPQVFTFQVIQLGSFIAFWPVLTVFSLIGRSPKEVFRRTCCYYAFAVFLLILSTIAWFAWHEDNAECLGMVCDLSNILVPFLFGIPTALVALLLGFGNLQGRTPEFENPYGRKIPPG